MQTKLWLNPETHSPMLSLSWRGSEEYLDQPVSRVKTKCIQSGCKVSVKCKISFEGEISFNSKLVLHQVKARPALC